jgi:hypothetical protein
MVPDLNFEVIGAEAVPFCAVPTLALHLRISADRPVAGVTLDCQIRIDAQRRRYQDGEKARLVELFGAPADWSRTLRSLLWTHVQANVPRFEGETGFDLMLPCTFDFNVVATKYFHALDADTEVPLVLLFAGSVFYAGERGELQMARIPWSKEAAFRLPATTWKRVIDIYYPESAWLYLRRDIFDRLAAYKGARTLPTWERVFEELLASAQEPVT